MVLTPETDPEYGAFGIDSSSLFARGSVGGFAQSGIPTTVRRTPSTASTQTT